MIRKILLFTLLTVAALPARAQTDTYCISSAKLTELQAQIPGQNPDFQRAYNELFQILVSKNEKGPVTSAGCVTQQELAQICKNIWLDATEMCKTFLSKIVTSTSSQNNFTTQEYSELLEQIDFNSIDPAAFNQAFNKLLARRANKSKASKLQDMGPVFLEKMEQEHINPFIAAAIAMYESTYGTSTKAHKKNNIAGLQGSKGYISYPTVPDSIAGQAKTLRTWSASNDLRGLAYSGHYCAKNVATGWHKDVSSIARRLYRYYNEIVQSKK